MSATYYASFPTVVSRIDVLVRDRENCRHFRLKVFQRETARTQYCVSFYYLYAQDECERNASAPVYRQFVHRFHWSENIEHSSPWVRHRTREIFNHVSKLLETQKRDTSEIGGQKTFGNSAANAVRGNGVVGETDDDDSAMVTCELASKLCDAIVKHDETGGKVLSPQRQCSRNDGRFKWTELYTKLVNRGQL